MSIDAKDLVKELRKIITEATKRETVKAITDSTQKNIEERTRKGFGLSESGNKRPLKSLRPRTVKIRKQLKEDGKLTGEGAIPQKSNVSRSGDLLKTMVTKSKKGEGEIKYNKQESQRKLGALLKLHSGFRFFGVTNEEEKNIITNLRKIVNNAIRKFNNK